MSKKTMSKKTMSKKTNKSTKLAFVQSDSENGYLSSSCLFAAEALSSKGYEIIKFSRRKQPPYDLITRDTPVKGSTSLVRQIYERVFGVPYPNFDIPPGLERFARRRSWQTTMKSAREIFYARHASDPGVRLFVKPLLDAKLFHGTEMLWDPTKISGDTAVSLQEYRSFWDETRIFIWNGKACGLTAATTDSRLKFAEKVARKWKNAPRAYVMDIGRTNLYENKDVLGLIETNSILTAGGFNVGDSLLTEETLASMLIDAWKSYSDYAETGHF